MQTKQNHIKAKLPKKSFDNGNNKYHCQGREIVERLTVVDKKTENIVLECIVSMGKSSRASTVYCDLSIYNVKHNKMKNLDWSYDFGYGVNKSTSLDGHGSAGGGGYDKISAAVGDAIKDSGIELYGSAYPSHGESADFKKRVHIGGTGCHREALLSIVYACGYNNVIVVG